MSSTLPLATGLWVACLLSSVSAFDCPSLATVEGPDIAAQIAPLLPAGDDLVAPDQLSAAVFDLHRQGVAADDAVNSLFAAYCPRIAANGRLSEAEKNDRAAAFTSMATGLTYATYGGQP